MDFQLYSLAPIVFIVYYYFPTIGIIWNFVLILVGVIISLAPKVIWGVPYIFEYPPNDSIWTTVRSVILYYWRIDSHIVSYVLGMFCGYLVRQKPDLYLGGRIGELFLWITCTALTIISMFWINNFWDPYYPLTETEVLLFLALAKIMYLCGWFWMIYACATGRGGMFRYRIFCSLFLYSFVRFYQSVL